MGRAVFRPFIGPAPPRAGSDIGESLRAEPALAGGPGDTSLGLEARFQQLPQCVLEVKYSFLNVSRLP